MTGLDIALAGAVIGGLNSLEEMVKETGNAIMDDSDPGATTDLADIRAALSGDEDAYSRIVNRYQPLVFRQMYRFSRDAGVVEELVQEAFVEAYFSLKSYRATAPFLHWLRRIATRVGYRHWKRKERRVRIDAAAREAAHVAAGESPRSTDAGEVVFGFLERLAPPDRLVLTLMYLEQCDSGEIADRTGWSRTLVRVRAHRARGRLRRILEAEGIEL